MENQSALGEGSLYLQPFTAASLVPELIPVISSFPPDIVPTERAGDYRRSRQMTSSERPSRLLRTTASFFRPAHASSSFSPWARVRGGRDESSVFTCNRSITVPFWFISQGLLGLKAGRGAPREPRVSLSSIFPQLAIPATQRLFPRQINSRLPLCQYRRPKNPTLLDSN